MMTFRPATFDDGRQVLRNLRVEQRRTVDKLDLDVMALLSKVMTSHFPSTTVLIDDQVAAVFGVTKDSLLSDAKIWMITTSLIEKEPVAFLRASRRFTEELYSAYGPLIGMVDSDFEKSQRWLRWIGFKEIRQGNFILMRYEGGH